MRLWIPAAAAALLAGCPGHPGSDAGPDSSCGATLEWGLREGGAFVPLHDGDIAPVTLGFQGFRFVAGAARIVGVSSPDATFRFDAHLDGQDPSSQSAGRFDLSTGPDGALYADGLQLFFNDIPLQDVLGHAATVNLAMSASGCTAAHTVRVMLVRGCDQLPDGGLTCDAGM